MVLWLTYPEICTLRLHSEINNLYYTSISLHLIYYCPKLKKLSPLSLSYLLSNGNNYFPAFCKANICICVVTLADVISKRGNSCRCGKLPCEDQFKPWQPHLLLIFASLNTYYVNCQDLCKHQNFKNKKF